MDQAYLDTKKSKLLKNAERGLTLAKAKLQNRLVVMIDKDGKTELTYDQSGKKEGNEKRCIRLNTGNESSAVGYSTPISNVLDILEAGRPKIAATELNAVLNSIQETLTASSTSVQFLKMAMKNLKILCQIDENFPNDLNIEEELSNDDSILKEILSYSEI